MGGCSISNTRLSAKAGLPGEEQLGFDAISTIKEWGTHVPTCSVHAKQSVSPAELVFSCTVQHWVGAEIWPARLMAVSINSMINRDRWTGVTIVLRKFILLFLHCQFYSMHSFLRCAS